MRRLGRELWDELKQSQAQLHSKVITVLRRWDPIGVISESHLDEYDRYASTIVRLLNEGADVQKMVDHMRNLVLVAMGMASFDEPHSRKCAEELVSCWTAFHQG